VDLIAIAPRTASQPGWTFTVTPCGIGGVHGRIRLGDAGGVFILYHFDIGADGSQLTLQIAGGLGYQTNWAGVSLTYRYLSFEQGSSTVHHMGLGGPMLAVNFDF
jgi:hypothetical protein